MLQIIFANKAKLARMGARFTPHSDDAAIRALKTTSQGAVMSKENAGEPQNHASRGAGAGKHAALFTVAGASVLAIVTLIFAIITRLSIFDSGFHIAFAMALGVICTAGLGFGLMALVFYSNRSGADDAVINPAEPAWRDAQGEETD
jgi:hypothetical protein